MLELDEIVRQNQLNCLPVSKSGRAEAELLENHPELIERLQHSKRVKVDAVSLHSHLYERESRQGGAFKTKVDLLEDFAPTSSIQRDQRRRTSKDHISTPKSPSLLAQNSPNLAASRSPILAPSKSPMLSAKKSIADLMFDMDDYDDGEGTFQTPKRRHRHAADPPRLPPSGLGLDDDDAFPAIGLSQSPGAEAALATSAKSPPSFKVSNDLKDQQCRLVSGDTKPWASSLFSSSKLDMKDVMAQTSSDRISSISSGLAASSHQRDLSSGSLPTKVSQKERKRRRQQQQQQQQRQQQTHPPIAVSPSSPDVGAGQPGQRTPTSPWQVASRGPKVNLKDVLDTAKPSPAATKTAAMRPTSPMTLRQTVSGKPPSTQRSISSPAGPTTAPASHQRPTSSNGPPPSSRSVSATVPNIADFPVIHSSRHTPAPAEPTLQLSMADILAQQNREKEIIKESAAKRSLQEIQEEQAFQKWWDMESKKVKEEEEAVRRPAMVGRGGKAGRARSRAGRGGRSGGSKGKGKGSEEDGPGESSTTVQKGFNVPRATESGRGRL